MSLSHRSYRTVIERNVSVVGAIKIDRGTDWVDLVHRTRRTRLPLKVAVLVVLIRHFHGAFSSFTWCNV